MAVRTNNPAYSVRGSGAKVFGPRASRPRTEAYYIDGNTVRVYSPEDELRRRDLRRRAYADAARRHTRSREAVRTKSLSINFPLTLILIAMVAAVLYVGYNYLCLKSSIDIHMDRVKTLETTLETMKNENDALERSIDTSIDLNYVYDTAVTRLGMVRADQDNVLIYDKTESEYVRQYDSIPRAGN